MFETAQYADAEPLALKAAMIRGVALGEQHPEFGARHGWEGHVWDDAMARRLNELLDRFDAPEGAP